MLPARCGSHSISRQAKIEPRHDAWPPTWRLPSGAIRIDASFKEPGRQKIVDKTTKAVAFLALVSVTSGHQQWPWQQLISMVLDLSADPGPIPLAEQGAAWLLVTGVSIGAIICMFRLLLAAAGVDHGRISATFRNDRLEINGSIFERRIFNGFEIEPHHLGKIEGQNEKRVGQATGLYYRDAFTVILHYGGRRIEIAHVLGRQHASALLARLQEAQKNLASVISKETSTASRHKPSICIPSKQLSKFSRT